MKNYVKNHDGFSLIEILVATGILSLLAAVTFFVGFPEYDRYIVSAEREYLVDTFLESRARSLAGSSAFAVSVWSNGYCIQDASGLCVTPIHDLPPNISLTSTSLATSTRIILAFAGGSPENVLQAEINIDQYGFVIGQ